MNNTEFNFDPITGQPLSNTNITNTQTLNTINQPSNNLEQATHQVPPVQPINQPILQPQPITQDINTLNDISTQQIQMQSIPTVEQSTSDFINNTQAQNVEKKDEKKNGINYAFIIILFAIIFAAIFFLFPLLLKYI